ncbi:MAG: hypothetical protein ACR2OC_05580 [Solirubrobacterales bacterium]
MAKVRTTLTIDENVLRSVKREAARSGRRDSDVIEESVKKNLGLGVIEEIWERSDLSADDAMELALEAQRWARRNPR